MGSAICCVPGLPSHGSTINGTRGSSMDAEVMLWCLSSLSASVSLPPSLSLKQKNKKDDLRKATEQLYRAYTGPGATLKINAHHHLAFWKCKPKPYGTSPHTCENSCHHKDKKQQVLLRIQRKSNPHTLLLVIKLMQSLWGKAQRFVKILRKIAYDVAIPFVGVCIQRIQ